MNRRLRIVDYLRTSALVDLDRHALIVVAVTSIAMNLLLFALPLYSLQVYDRVMTSRSEDTLIALTLIVLFALFANSVLDAIRTRLLLRIGNAYALKLGPRLLEAAISKSAREAEPQSRALHDMATVRGFVCQANGLATLYDAPLVPLFLAAVYFMHTGLGHAMLLGVVVLLVLTYATESLTGGALRAASESSMAAQRRIDCAMQNAESVEAMGMRAAMKNYWFAAQGEALAEASIASDRAAIVGAAAKWTRLFLSLLITGVGAWYVIRDEITVGAMVAASILSARGLAPLETLINAWRAIVSTRLAVERINGILETDARQEVRMQLPNPTGSLSVERVAFSPPGSDLPTLKGVTFRLQPGQWLGVVGPSAAGKSTLAKLICGVWKPRSGTVRLDGADVYDWSRADFGRHCGYLPQSVELFPGTVRDNIARFADQQSVSDALVVEAAQMAQVHDMILKLPKGYDTQIGPNAAALSAGQRQRVGLARALLGKPCLIVLDEPDANLDTEGEVALVHALQAARSNGATIVMISHRPALLASADMIGVLVEGALQHFGPREAVFAKILPRPRIQAEAQHGAN